MAINSWRTMPQRQKRQTQQGPPPCPFLLLPEGTRDRIIENNGRMKGHLEDIVKALPTLGKSTKDKQEEARKASGSSSTDTKHKYPKLEIGRGGNWKLYAKISKAKAKVKERKKKVK